MSDAGGSLGRVSEGPGHAYSGCHDLRLRPLSRLRMYHRPCILYGNNSLFFRRDPTGGGYRCCHVVCYDAGQCGSRLGQWF